MPKPSKKSKKTNRRIGPTCALVSLGCPKNLVDSEQMLGRLIEAGYRWVNEPDGADVVVVNTCGFLDTAREESLAVIRQMGELKRRGRIGGIIVAGCLAQRDGARLLEACPDADQLLGLFARDQIATAARRIVGAETGGDGAERLVFADPPACAPPDDRRQLLTLPHLAYLRIAEGCDRQCAFCSIPMIRGRYQSKSIDQVVAEARQLADRGVRELVLVAQDTSDYGRDLDGRPRLADLLGRLETVDGLAWIRLMYLYPRDFGDGLIAAVAADGKVLPYLDIPLQHINDEILRRMRRNVTRRQTEELLDRLRGKIPGLAIRTTLLVGFPGETDEQFEELLDFVRERRFERLGTFVYRREPGTASDRLDGHLSEEVKQARHDTLMAAQQEIAFAAAEAQIGRRRDVMIDRDIPGEKDAYVGRTSADAPEVDAAVYVTGKKLRGGRIVPCEIVAAREYDLIGVAVGQPR